MQNVIGFVALFVILLFVLAMCSPSDSGRYEMTYRLVQASGNSERIAARGLSRSECEARKRELQSVTAILGTGGSVTCLPESVFE